MGRNIGLAVGERTRSGRVGIPLQRFWKRRSSSSFKSLDDGMPKNALAECDETLHTAGLSYRSDGTCSIPHARSTPSVGSELTSSIQSEEPPLVHNKEKTLPTVEPIAEEKPSDSSSRHDVKLPKVTQGTELIFKDSSVRVLGVKKHVDIVESESADDVSTPNMMPSQFEETKTEAIEQLGFFARHDNEIALNSKEEKVAPGRRIDVVMTRSRSFRPIKVNEEKEEQLSPGAPLAEIEIPLDSPSDAIYAPSLAGGSLSGSEEQVGHEFDGQSEVREKIFESFGDPKVSKANAESVSMKPTRLAGSSPFVPVKKTRTAPPKLAAPPTPRTSLAKQRLKKAFEEEETKEEVVAAQLGFSSSTGLWNPFPDQVNPEDTSEQPFGVEADSDWVANELRTADDDWVQSIPAKEMHPINPGNEKSGLVDAETIKFSGIDADHGNSLDEFMEEFMEELDKSDSALLPKQKQKITKYSTDDRLYSLTEGSFEESSEGPRCAKLTLRSRSTKSFNSEPEEYAATIADDDVSDLVSETSFDTSGGYHTGFLCQDMFACGPTSRKKTSDQNDFSSMLRDRLGLSRVDRDYLDGKKAEALLGLQKLTEKGSIAVQKFLSKAR